MYDHIKSFPFPPITKLNVKAPWVYGLDETQWQLLKSGE
jgi:hypothetical protein